MPREVTPSGILAVGMIVYPVYRHRHGLDLTTTTKVAIPRPATETESEYESVLVVFDEGGYVPEVMATAARLAARDIKDVVYGDAPDVARGHELIGFRDDDDPGTLQRARHLRHGHARQSEFSSQTVHAPAPAAGYVRAADQVHELQ